MKIMDECDKNMQEKRIWLDNLDNPDVLKIIEENRSLQDKVRDVEMNDKHVNDALGYIDELLNFSDQYVYDKEHIKRIRSKILGGWD
jgi:hypothetical protein